MSSLLKKYLMAVTGFILVGFVIGHMAGNLQMFLHPDWINEYAYKLHNLPYGLLYIVRVVLISTVAIHVVTAVLLILENRRARPRGYSVQRDLQASFASKTMRYTGFVLIAFIVFHILHFTTRDVHPELGKSTAVTSLEGVGTIHHVHEKLETLADARGLEYYPVHDVYTMVATGFSSDRWYSIAAAVFYLVAMALLFLHLSHGISSMFQSLGLRNAVWRQRLDRAALAVAILLFLGFGSLPVAGLLKIYPHQDMVQTWDQLQAEEAVASDLLSE